MKRPPEKDKGPRRLKPSLVIRQARYWNKQLSILGLCNPVHAPRQRPTLTPPLTPPLTPALTPALTPPLTPPLTPSCDAGTAKGNPPDRNDETASLAPSLGENGQLSQLSTGGDDKLSTGAENNDNPKEKGEKKENLPPCTPYKRKKRAPKEKAGAGAETRTRVLISSPDDRAAMIAKVAEYNSKLKGNIDAAFFVDYYLSNAGGFPYKWKSRFRNWLKCDKSEGRIPYSELAKQANRENAAKLDWSLCAERCKSFTGEGCRRGYLCPPACLPDPRPPEECPKFTPLDAKPAQPKGHANEKN